MKVLKEARRVFEIESKAILSLAERLDQNFVRAIELLKECQGKVIVSGVGKSGLIGRKIAATLSSTGTPAFFLHPAEGAHGDLGVVSPGDLLVVISYGGESEELSVLIGFAARKGIPVMAMTGRLESHLAESADVTLDIGIKREACPLGLAPTASTSVTLAMGDALAVALMSEKGIRVEDFAENHPGGSLGRRLLTKVKDVMHAGEALPLVTAQTSAREVLSEMTKKDVQGVAGIVDEQGYLVGIVTDGDLRRSLEVGHDFHRQRAKDLMSQNPKTIDEEELAERALFIMEQFQIQTLFAIRKEKNGEGEVYQKPVGLLHLQDLLKAKIR